MVFYKVRYLFDPRHVLEFKREKGKELLNSLWEEVCSKISAEKLIKCDAKFNEISVIICDSNGLSQDDIETINEEISTELGLKDIVTHIEKTAPSDALQGEGILPDDREYLLNFVTSEDTGVGEKNKEKGSRNKEEAVCDTEDFEDIFEKVNSLIAMEDLKLWAKDMKAFTGLKTDSKRMSKPVLSMSYLVSANDGNGCSTAFEVMGKVIARILGRKSVEVKEFSIEPDKDAKAYNIPQIINIVDSIAENSDKLYVLALKIDKFQNNSYMGSWIHLLSELRNNPKALFVFVLPYLEQIAINDMHKQISDIMPNRVIMIKPFNNDDYRKFFELYFKKLDMSVNEDALAILPELVAEEKSDGRFYGIDTINKLCDEILFEKLKWSVSEDSDIDTITVSDAERILKQSKVIDDDGLTGMQKLDSLVSLHEVKSRIREIVAAVKMQRQMNGGITGSMHMMFSGPPGTGKTVVARLLGQILREANLLSAGGFYEVSRKDLVGTYVGHTAPKTAEVCQLARGSVLFIDEAYSLNGGGSSDFGKEAISTLIAEMENYRHDFVVVFAGYEKELEELFDLNPGLRDRIPYRVSFPSYSRSELCQIFYKMIPEEFIFEEDFKQKVNDFFENLSENIIDSPNFSNARFVRNLVERVLSKASLRTQMSGAAVEKLDLIAADFELAIADGEFKSVNDKKKRKPIGFN